MIKNCKRCGCEFEAKSARQEYCNKIIRRKCIVCGCEYETTCGLEYSEVCENKECKKRAGTIKSRNKIKVCKNCGRPFRSNSPRQVYCNQHIKKICVICGNEFDSICNGDDVKTCSQECVNQLVAKSAREFYLKTTRICKLCGKKFNPETNTQIYCKDDHYKKCVVCGSEFLIKRNADGNIVTQDIPVTCSEKCRTALLIANGNIGSMGAAKAREAYQAKTGYSSPFSNPEVIEKIKETNLERYGDTAFVRTPEYIDKSIKTNIERYGCEWPIQSEAIQKKAADTLFEHYGVTRTMDSQELRERQRQSTIVSTGYPSAMQSPIIQEKFKRTIRDRYGVDYLSQFPEFREKAIATNLARFGVKNPMQSLEVQSKAKETCIQRYGFDNPVKSPKVKDKMRKTARSKYVVDWYNSSTQFRVSQMKDPSKANEFAKFIDNTKLYIESNFDHKPSFRELSDKLGVSETTVSDNLRKLGLGDLVCRTLSYGENELSEFILSANPGLHIVRNDRQSIRPQELDIYIPDFNIAIEYNPTYTHNSSAPSFQEELPKPVNYHLNKTIKCEEAGIFLFHLFGYEWTNKRSIMESMIRNLIGANVDKVYARNCYVKGVSAEDSRKFLNENHRQGYAAASVKMGLYDKKTDRLVSLMTFGKMRNTIGTGKEDLSDCWELIRFCNVLNTSVVGGASKLFKHFVDSYKPSRIRSFSDRAHTRGTLYSTLGFKYVHSSEPSYVWIDSFTDTAYNRVNAQKQNIKAFLHDDSIDLNKSEKQIMEEHGFLRMYDCGTILWEWKSENK